jgi:hypothetical protein
VTGLNLPLNSEVANRERHLAEDTARVADLGLNAFLVGNGELGCADDKLTGTDKPNHREKSDGHSKIPLNVIAKRIADLTGYALGNVAAGATAATRRTLFFLDYTGGKNNGVYYLKNCLGRVIGAIYGLRRGTEGTAILTAEDLGRIFASEEDHVLVDHRNAVEFLSATAGHTGLEDQLDEQSNIHRVKAAIELNAAEPNGSPGDLRTLGAHVACVLDYIVAESCQQNANVLKAVSVAAGVEDTAGLNTHVFAWSGGRAAGKFAIRHKKTSLC